MNPEYTLKFKLYWEVKNPKTIEVTCTVCCGTGLYEENSYSMGPNFEDCPYCMKTGKMIKVDPDQYPEIDPFLEHAIRNLINGWKYNNGK